MEIKKPLPSDKYTNISAETSKDSVDVSRSASEIKKGIGGAKDVFETAKKDPFQSKLASLSVVQKGQTFTEQVVNNAAKGILEAARRNPSDNEAENQTASVNAVAQAQLAVSAVVEQRATPGWAALKKDHDD